MAAWDANSAQVSILVPRIEWGAGRTRLIFGLDTGRSGTLWTWPFGGTCVAIEQGMWIELSTDNHISGTEHLKELVTEWVTKPLDRFDQLRHLLVHLGDEIGERPGAEDKRCTLEARLEGRQPTVVVHHAPTVEAAVRGAAQKLQRALEHEKGKIAARRAAS